MVDPYIGEIGLFAFGFAPQGWALCAGQLLPVAQNQALFSLLGKTYGGDGIRTFGLPDLRGRIAVGQGNGSGLSAYTLGQTGGTEEHTLTTNELPQHNHTVAAVTSTTGYAVEAPAGNLLAVMAGLHGSAPTQILAYAAEAPDVTMKAGVIGATGNSPHPNLMPYVVLNACIALTGLYPTRS